MHFNFRALLRDRGKIVPGSRREGHNIFTLQGKEMLARLVAWQVVSTETLVSNDRVRGIGIGEGVQPEVEGVTSLVDHIDLGGGVYVTDLDMSATSWPTIRTVRFAREFTESEPSTAVIVTEAGLYTNASTPRLIAYKTFEGLLKIAGFSLEIEWDLSF